MNFILLCKKRLNLFYNWTLKSKIYWRHLIIINNSGQIIVPNIWHFTVINILNESLCRFSLLIRYIIVEHERSCEMCCSRTIRQLIIPIDVRVRKSGQLFFRMEVLEAKGTVLYNNFYLRNKLVYLTYHSIKTIL